MATTFRGPVRSPLSVGLVEGGEGERDGLVGRQLPALLPGLGEGGLVELVLG